MNNAPERQAPDILHRAAGALRSASVPSGPPDDLVAATVAAIGIRFPIDEPDQQDRKLVRRKRLMRIMTFGGAVAAMAAVVLAAVFGISSGTAADDVKKALRKAEKAKSARMVIEMDAGDDGKMTSKSFFDNGKYRSEVEPAGLVLVVNAAADKKGVMLLTKTKMYRLLDPEKDELVKGVTKNVRSALEQFKIPSDDNVKGLPDEYLDGRKTKVYEMKGVEVKDLKGTADLKLWIDPQTTMPVRSRVTTKVSGKTYIATATFLGFDEELDPKLFDTSVPKGYKPIPDKK